MTDVSSSLPDLRPALTDTWVPAGARALTLVLHGGAEHGTRPVDGTSLSWRRGRALARHIAPDLTAVGIGVVLLRYRVKGWNSDGARMPDPVVDARWALQEIGERHGLPVAVLGHSMGGRTAVAIADHPSVRGVAALAPWWPPGEPVSALAGKCLRAAHGGRDRITSARATRQFVDRAGRVADATVTDMGAVGHYLLRGMPAWNRFATTSLQELLAEA